jgi:hypothetical protein
MWRGSDEERRRGDGFDDREGACGATREPARRPDRAATNHDAGVRIDEMTRGTRQ